MDELYYNGDSLAFILKYRNVLNVSKGSFSRFCVKPWLESTTCQPLSPPVQKISPNPICACEGKFGSRPTLWKDSWSAKVALNLKVALVIWKKRKKLTPWTTFLHGFCIWNGEKLKACHVIARNENSQRRTYHETHVETKMAANDKR